ncbi:MAG: LysM peptidoglycan-binding domain-containing protein [Anaerolineae bacterium]|nr:LysM peptidoglycan-binding domain-containing protein [Anaerolineae bacterium]
MFILSQLTHRLPFVEMRNRHFSRKQSAVRFSSMMLAIAVTGIVGLVLVAMLASVTQTCIVRGGQTYRVQSGDTLYGLSLRFGVPVSMIAAASGIQDANYLYVHQDIVIPNTYCAPSYLLKDTLTAEATITSDWLTLRPTATPTADLTRTTATPTSAIDPIYLTATYIVDRATKTEAAYHLATLVTWTPAPPADLTRTTATPLNPVHITATYMVGRATQTQAAYQTATASAEP